MKREYEITQEEVKTIMAPCFFVTEPGQFNQYDDPIQGLVEHLEPLKNKVSEAWNILAIRRGFDPTTIEPSPNGPTFFFAEEKSWN